MARVNGLHHITAIAGPAQENLDFYAGVLGMRLVKKASTRTIRAPITCSTPTPKAIPAAISRSSRGRTRAAAIRHGLAVEVALEVPPDSLTFWGSRLDETARRSSRRTRFGERVLSVVDPHGLRVAWSKRRRRGGCSHPGTAARSRKPDSRSARRPLVGARARADDAFLTARLASRRSATRRLDPLRLQDAPGVVDLRRRPRLGAAPGASAASTISPGGWTTGASG